ncbi:hypothetical protein MNBD_GAMMA16-1745 [hydrothermal vent metagenome]|uniref:Dynamin N-terminal domain-containing protein n=1 Tax=hydrothermal vent metagenome TaxID=652676 RepID=A0A3B0ZG32_9ZZZZ
MIKLCRAYLKLGAKKRMGEDRLKIQIEELVRWKFELTTIIQKYQDWLNATKLDSAESDLKIFDALESVRSDQLTIAFVAEFSRGKTELINAIFFADYKRRLLPSTVGRTTMCPTELLYDADAPGAYIKLLPIETRSQDDHIADLKRDSNAWTVFSLDIGSADNLAHSLQEVVKSKMVPIAEAKALALYDESMHNNSANPPSEIEIPVWRHAIISFPHPLLKQGLVILDTPGLNALGTEPELTLNMLPAAQAIVFVLAPDTGVTKSDLDIWRMHIQDLLDTRNPKTIIAALNKIDTLWDEMKTEEEIDAAINQQVRVTAELLNIDAANVLPVSAQKALVAKSRHDNKLLEKSRILTIESHLADEIIPYKQEIIGNKVLNVIGSMIENHESLLRTRLDKLTSQRDSYFGATGKNGDVIKHLTQKTRQQQVAYNENMKHMQSSRRLVVQYSNSVMNELSLDAFDYLVAKTRKDMTESWTTIGLKKGITVFFASINETMQIVFRQMEETHEVIESIYEKFHKDHGLPEMQFKKFTVDPYIKHLTMLSKKADDFRNSPITTMTEQNFVVKKFFVLLVSHTREVFFRANVEAEAWFKNIMSPLMGQIAIHKQMLEQHLETLCKISDSKDTLSKNIITVEKQYAVVAERFTELESIHKQLIGHMEHSDNTTQQTNSANIKNELEETVTES